MFNPTIPTRGVSNRNHLRSRCKQVTKFTSPCGTSLGHHWWPWQGSPKLKVSQHRSEKDCSSVNGKVYHGKQGQSLWRWQPPKWTLAFPFSLYLLHSPRCSEHNPDTSIDSPLCPHIPRSTHRTICLVSLHYLSQMSLSQSLPISTSITLVSATTVQRRHNYKRVNTAFGELKENQCGFSYKGKRESRVGQS